ncbi:MAG: STIV orfB116 family protein [bacterium]
MRIVLANAFSVNMLAHDGYYFFGHITEEFARDIVALNNNAVFSIIGHQSTADLLSVKLHIPVSVNRINYIKQKDDQIIVATPAKRLEEGKVLTLDELKQIDVKFRLVK